MGRPGRGGPRRIFGAIVGNRGRRLVVHGGVKIYRGNPAAARNYVEADHARVDDYYLAEGTGLAERFAATADGVERVGALAGDGYEAWVAGLDPLSREPRGRLRTDAKAVRFSEVVVNGPKTWSLAAAVDPEIADAYDAAMDRAAAQIIGWLAEHSTTRVGPRGRQVQVPVERLEAVTVRHYTSRAGDPHRHLHLQINARVWAAGKWRGLHTVGMRDSIDAINGIGHAAIMCDPEFRHLLADRGYTLNPETGEINELSTFVGPFSARARQIGANIASYETEWRASHPGAEPGPELVRAWDRRAWSRARPDKVTPTDGGQLNDRWVDELHRLGFREPRHPRPVGGSMPGALDRDAAVEVMVDRLGAKRSGWNAADIRGEAEQLIARSGVVTDAAVRRELAEDLTARAVEVCVPLLAEEPPEHIRALTSTEVRRVEADITNRLAARATAGQPTAVQGGLLDEAQLAAVAALAGTHRLVVVEGAAGAGKTATLASARKTVEAQGKEMVVVTPTLKAAQVAAGEVGAEAFSAAWFVHRHGFRWDDNGRWTRDLHTYMGVGPGDLLVVDEAGMLDQDTARALLTIADEAGARVAFVGDRHQLPAVGRGGVLDLAANAADPTAVVTLDRIHRFADPAYAELSLAMRSGFNAGDVFDQLLRRGQIVVHATEAERTDALATIATATGAAIIADTRDQVAELNAAIRDRRVVEGRVDDRTVVITDAGERIGRGDRVATRHNDRKLGVANRDVWTVGLTDRLGRVVLTNGDASRVVDADYSRRHLELAYATTAYGAQGATVSGANVAVGDHTGAASAYVAMTRGRDNNTAHLVADSVGDARRQWVDVFSRDRADLGPAHVARLAAEEAAKYVPAPKRRLERANPLPEHLRRPSPSPSRGPGIGF